MNIPHANVEHYVAGFEAGTAAGSWVEIDDAASAQSIVTGYDDGDPAIMDMAPAPLSGEWAGESLTELGLADATDEELTSFEEGYSEGFWTEVLRAAKHRLT